MLEEKYYFWMKDMRETMDRFAELCMENEKLKKEIERLTDEKNKDNKA